jgi:NMD protein affecting ribosome stability and mRNA decay
VVCPACRRIADDYPDGSLLVSGAFAAERREEILALARHQEEREKAEHPLNRIVRTREEGAGLRITTTRRRLARTIGRALERAYGGELTATSDEENLLRLHWKRD